MSFVAKLNQFLTPPSVVTSEHYDGWQLRYRFLVFRPAELKFEGAILLLVIGYIAFWFYGSSVNKARAQKWLDAHLEIYRQQFSRNSKATQDGYSDIFTFSTGRRNIMSMHTVFRMQPRHDLAQYLYHIGRTFVDLQYHPEDELVVDFKLAPGALSDNFVWALVNKEHLVSAKEGRWDLEGFTKSSENATLPHPLSIVFTEFADVTENLLKPLGNFNLVSVLQDKKIHPYFRSLSISDQPRERPLVPLPAEEKERHLILRLAVPPEAHAADTVPLVAAVFQLIDNLNKIQLRPETKTKLKKIREDVNKKIKDEAEREKKEEEAEAKLAAKKKAKDEQMSKLSAAEQAKELEKERKRTMRKAQGKVVRK